MHGPKTLCFIRQQVLAGQRWVPHVVFLTEKRESRCLSLERKLFLTSRPPPTLLNVTCVIKKSETCQATFKCWLRMAMGLTANAKLSIPSGLQLPENNVVTDVWECEEECKGVCFKVHKWQRICVIVSVFSVYRDISGSYTFICTCSIYTVGDCSVALLECTLFLKCVYLSLI